MTLMANKSSIIAILITAVLSMLPKCGIITKAKLLDGSCIFFPTSFKFPYVFSAFECNDLFTIAKYFPVVSNSTHMLWNHFCVLGRMLRAILNPTCVSPANLTILIQGRENPQGSFGRHNCCDPIASLLCKDITLFL